MSGTTILIGHYRRPRHRGEAVRPDLRREIHNRKCGDRITLTAQIEADRLREIRFEGEGCMYCLASASILCSTLNGKSTGEARRQISLFRDWLRDRKQPEGVDGAGLTEEMRALGEVKAFPMRIDCADLAWKCAGEMLEP
jgi:nitrogen fixation protein NifU and related proteins